MLSPIDKLRAGFDKLSLTISRSDIGQIVAANPSPFTDTTMPA